MNFIVALYQNLIMTNLQILSPSLLAVPQLNLALLHVFLRKKT